MVEVKKVVKYGLIILVIVLVIPTLLVLSGILLEVARYPAYPLPPLYFDLKNVSALNSSDGDKITLTMYCLSGNLNKTLPISSLWAEIKVRFDRISLSNESGVVEMFYNGSSAPIKKISMTKWGEPELR